MIGVGIAATFPRRPSATRTLPLGFAVGQWGLSDSPSPVGDRLMLTVLALPFGGGLALTALEAQLDSGAGFGAAVALVLTGPGAQPVTVPVGVATAIRLRAVNALGAGPWSVALSAVPSAAMAPVFTGAPSGSVAGRVVTIGTGTVSGAPTLSIAVTVGGVAVSPDGTGPWSVSVPSSETATTVDWVVTATNGNGSATSSGSSVVAADLSMTPVTAVAANGWQATWPAPPVINPVGAPQVLAVTRPGFTATGAATMVTDNVTVMARVRQPYPNQAALTADQVALSDFVYAGDTIPGVANGSTVAYPRPVCCWLTPDLERATGNTFTARLAVAHAHARGGRAVAAVTFIASDGTNTVSQTVSAMSSRQWASGLWAPYFECSLDLTGLNPATICTLDAIVYPWVGVAFQASVQGAAYPSINFTVLKFLNDRSGSYGTAYAYVDAGAGSNATGAVSATAAVAAAAPFQTVAAAAAAVKTFNTGAFGRAEAAGGVIRLVAGSHAHANFAAATANTFPLLIEAADPAAKAATIYTDNGVNVSAGLPAKVKFQNLTLRKVGASVILLDNGAGLANLDRMLVLQNVAFDRAGASAYAAWVYRTGRCWMLDCSGDPAGSVAMFNTVTKEINLIGCSLPGQTTTAVYNAVASLFGNGSDMANTVGMEPAAGQMFHHCLMSQSNVSGKAFLANTAIGPAGLAVVGCVMEATSGNTAPALAISADSVTQPAQNVSLTGCTVVGSRSNWLYQDTGSTTIAKSGYLRFNVNSYRNTKTDVFASNGALTGNWAASYNVGSRSNAALLGDNAGHSACGVGLWLGEAAAAGDATGAVAAPLAVSWADDQSFAGGGGGLGDYTPAPGNALPLIPAGLAPYPVDQKGRAVSNTGSARAGAIQMA
ncbi:MAG: hypothetical protein GC186_20595 [Rhodobacteraceae bacterium]|nr:hypothetical protein [Paracoccaceae bacterium]